MVIGALGQLGMMFGMAVTMKKVRYDDIWLMVIWEGGISSYGMMAGMVTQVVVGGKWQ